MKNHNNLNRFAEEVKEDHTQPKGTPSNNRSNDVVDPEEKTRLRTKIFK
jgi:hypothetical protein